MQSRLSDVLSNHNTITKIEHNLSCTVAHFSLVAFQCNVK